MQAAAATANIMIDDDLLITATTEVTPKEHYIVPRLICQSGLD